MSIRRVHFTSAAGTFTTSAKPLFRRSVHSLQTLSVGSSSGSPHSVHGSSVLVSSVEHDGAGRRFNGIVFVFKLCAFFGFFVGFVS